MIRAEHLSYSYGFGPVFSDVNFSVGKGQKVGLVGPNGAGKSTLFKLLLGHEQINGGKLEVFGTVGHVPQEIKYDSVMEKSRTIREYIDPEGKKEDHELFPMFHGMELDLILSDQPKNLSGGQKTKLAVLRALIEQPDILLLDEPTNFLDTVGKAWIMQFLSTYPKTLIIISHDLPLLDASIDKVLAINPFTKKIEEYKGNYTLYEKIKKQHDELLRRQVTNEQKHIRRMEEGLRRMARYTSKKGVRQRTQLKRRIERLKEALPELPKEIQRIKVTIPSPPPTGEIPIAAKHITKLFDNELVLADLSFSLYKNERVAILGPNGAGKSTFIKILVGILYPEDGYVEKDANLKIGYYSQEFETFNLQKTLLETVQGVSDLPENRIRPFLAKFNFPGEKIFQRIETLSGGEKTRLAIALLMLQNNNLLILDEPTTYLDMMSQRIILDALKIYPGAMIFVSHTEEFVEELQPNRILILPENKIDFWIPKLVEKVVIV